MSQKLGIDGSVLLRTLAVSAIGLSTSGCFLFFGGKPKPNLVSNDPGEKIPGIKKASKTQETQTAQQLVKSLESDDSVVRFYAIRALQNLTGETFGYVWFENDEVKRRPATEKWKQWLGANPSTNVAGAKEGPR